MDPGAQLSEYMLFSNILPSLVSLKAQLYE